MPKFIGRKLAVGVGKETSRGVGVSPTYWLRATAFKYTDKVTKVKSEMFSGGIWGGDVSLVAQKWAEGDIELEMTDKAFGLILLSTFGNISTGSFNGAYKHTFTLQNDSQHDSLSIHTTDPVGDLIFELGMLDKLVFKFTANDIVKCTASFKSKAGQGNIVTASYIAENRFLGRHLSLKLAAATGNLDAASKIAVKNLTLTIEKNAELYQTIGTVQPQDIVNKQFNIMGELELSFDDYTYKNYMLDGTYKAMRMDIVNGDVAIGSTNPSFRLDLSKVVFDTWDVDYPSNDLVNQKVNFSALYDFGGNNNLFNDCYLVNEITTY